MRTRYCDTTLQEVAPCNVGWANYSTDGGTTCRDEPAIKNCHNLVDPTSLHCPFCGTHIECGLSGCMKIDINDPRIVEEV